MNIRKSKIDIENVNEPHLAWTFLLDTLGSMYNAIDNFVGDLNEFIRKQRTII